MDPRVRTVSNNTAQKAFKYLPEWQQNIIKELNPSQTEAVFAWQDNIVRIVLDKYKPVGKTNISEK